MVCVFRGEHAGPVGRKKHTFFVSGSGVPLIISTAVANASDDGQVLPAVADVARILCQRGWKRSLRSSLLQNADTTARRRGCPAYAGYRTDHRPLRRG